MRSAYQSNIVHLLIFYQIHHRLLKIKVDTAEVVDTAQAVGIRVPALATAQVAGIPVQAQDGHQAVVATAQEVVVAGPQAAVVAGNRAPSGKFEVAIHSSNSKLNPD